MRDLPTFRCRAFCAAVCLLLFRLPVSAGLAEYDAAIAADAAGGLTFTAALGEAVGFDDGGVPFDFGAVSGDASFECIAEGRVSSSAYLATGDGSLSSLRFCQWPSTGNLGMTVRGLADYQFSPPVPLPAEPAHLVWVWDGAGTMRMFVNGEATGTSEGIDGSFEMPSGPGLLGAANDGGEVMDGTVHRVTVYNRALDAADIARHADAFLYSGPVPPTIRSFTATPASLNPGGEVTLTWDVGGADSMTVNGTNVTGLAQATFAPAATTTYTLSATNETGTTTRSLVVQVLATQPADHVVINEIMAENESTLADSFGEFSDWIELHNPTAAAIPLGGLFLTDDAAVPDKWPLPDEVLGPGAFRIVFASGRNLVTSGGEWHAGLRLSREGEYLALTGPAGVIHEFAPAFGPQDPDISFGLGGADPAMTGYLSAPTPGAPNSDALPLPGRVAFSRPPGLIGSGFELTLTTPTPGAQIRFRRNNGATVSDYTGPIAIDATTQITAWTEFAGRSSGFTTAGWVKLAPSLQSYSSPLPILVIDNFAAGTVPQKGWSGTGDGIRQVPRQPAAWMAWDRNGTTAATTAPPAFFSLAGIRGRGAYSSTWREKPYSVEAQDETGREADVSVLGMPAHSDWVLYFPDPDESRDPTLLFNTFVYDLSRRAGRYAPRFRWVELFLNEDGGDVSLNDRRGVYAVLEKVSRGAGRLDFDKLGDDGTTGGWLLSINRMDAEPEGGWPAENGATSPQFFRTAGPNRIQETTPNQPAQRGDDLPRQSNGFLNFDNPGGYRILPAQRAAIEGWFREFEDVLYDNAVWKDPANGYRRWIDDRDFAEYFVFNEITKNGDGMLISMFPWKGNDGRLRMGPTWDYNWSSYYIGGGPEGSLRWRGDRIWYGRLFSDPDFLQLFIDRWFAFRRGPMSDAGMDAIIDGQAAEITAPLAIRQGISSAAVWQSRLGTMKSWLKARAAWVDGNYVAPPTIDPAGGIVGAGTGVAIQAASGTVFRTLDGSDPRAPGGTAGASAGTGSTAIVSADTKVTARARASSQWSAPATAVYVTDAVPASAANLAIAEIHYHPADSSAAESAAGFANDGEFEFLELLNTGTDKVSLAGLRFLTGEDGAGIGFDFNDDSSRWSLLPGDRLVIAANREAFALRYGDDIPVAGEFSGNLGNSGDTLTIVRGDGTTVVSVAYSDSFPWPAEPDGSGPSLALTPGENPAVSTSWRASATAGGTPGRDDTVPFPGGDLVAWTLGGFAPELAVDGSSLVVRQRRLPRTEVATVALEVSIDLANWTPAGPYDAGADDGNGNPLMTWTLPLEAVRFLRFRIAVAP